MSPSMAATSPKVDVLPRGTVVIAGGGPIGLLLARSLSFYGVKSVLFERNKTTTKWPKMDLTNARSMEIFRKLGIADDLRKQGVPADIDQNVIISTGLSADKPLTQWDLPGVERFRQHIQQNNDGTQPLEPWQRVSQAIFERWLKAICDEDPMIDLRYGWKVEAVEEGLDNAKTTVTEVDTGSSLTLTSDYVVGCDGASSKVRNSLSIDMDGGPIPSCALLVHFKSRDLGKLHKQGRFWHIFLLGESGGFEGVIISQDEVDTWTVHLFLPWDADTDKLDSHEVVYKVLGGLYGPYPIAIDEILVRSVWRPTVAVAKTWSSYSRHVFLAGDSAHQNIPTGGYGMNMGIGDAFDLSWKLASVINGQGGAALLESYELERKPVALRNVQRSHSHFQVHTDLKGFLEGGDLRRVDSDTEEARVLRQQIHDHYQTNDGENRDMGVEMGFRYKSPIVLADRDDSVEPVWIPREYTPTTWPGGRPPHVFLSDGTAIFDALGKNWSLLVFSNKDVGQNHLAEAAGSLALDLVVIDLSREEHAKALYERNLVLLRPDHHVAWRAQGVEAPAVAEGILRTVTGL